MVLKGFLDELPSYRQTLCQFEWNEFALISSIKKIAMDSAMVQICWKSQIPVTRRGFELWASYLQCRYLAHWVLGLNRLGGLGVSEFAALC